MNTTTRIALFVLVLIIVLAVRYIVKAKKKGARCIGCPLAGSCQKKEPLH